MSTSRKEILSYLKVAAKIAARGQERRSFFLGTAAIRRDGALVSAFNGPTRYPCREAHAEARISRKLDVGATVYVARILRKTEEFANARPCDNCLKALKSRGVKRVYFTVGPNEFGWKDF